VFVRSRRYAAVVNERPGTLEREPFRRAGGGERGGK
jgi:hypothetical protein